MLANGQNILPLLLFSIMFTMCAGMDTDHNNDQSYQPAYQNDREMPSPQLEHQFAHQWTMPTQQAHRGSPPGTSAIAQNVKIFWV